MRILLSVLAVFLFGVGASACSAFDSVNDPNKSLAAKSEGQTGGGGTGTTTNTGGTGGCESADDCPRGNKCEVAVCNSDSTCSLSNKDCVGLECNTDTGLCQGCNDGDKPCPAKDCYTVTCNSKTKACDEEVAPTGTPCTDGFCAGEVCRKTIGVACASPDECGSGNCVDGVCCDGACAGTCMACNVAGSVGTCSGQAIGDPDIDCMMLGGCGATPGYCQCSDGMPNGDETDVDCGGPQCGGCATGSKCNVTEDCAADSTQCVDGFCCNAACTGPCLACDSLDYPGICSSPTAGSQDDLCNAAKEVCGTTGGTCLLDLGQSCSVNSQCASNNCKGGTLACKKCGGGGADCSAGDVCINGSCFTPGPNGKACQANGGCTSGNCVDGVCCNDACDGTCMACHENYTGQTSGTCTPILAEYDPHNECKGPGASGACSGTIPDANNASSCGKL